MIQSKSSRRGMLQSVWLYWLILILSAQLYPQYSVRCSDWLDSALNYLYVKEKTPNRSPDIDRWNRFVGSALGSSYCAAFISWNDFVGSSPNAVKSGLARNHIVKSKKGTVHSAREVLDGKYFPKKGDKIIWGKGETIKGHIAYVLFWQKDKGWTVEANTSSGLSGSQSNGDGVFIRFREIEPYRFFRIIAFVEV